MESEDVVRPSPESCRAVYEDGFRTWTRLLARAQLEPGLPKICFHIQPALRNTPPLIHDLDLKCEYNRLYAAGTSIWETSRGQCKISRVEKGLTLPVSIDNPTQLALSQNQEPTYHKWFNHGDNHLSVLISAWSYIFSARWVELMPGAEMIYTGSHAEFGGLSAGDERTKVMVDVGDVDDDAARWWAAVLSPGEGWQASLTWEGAIVRSPWSTALESVEQYTLSCRSLSCRSPLCRAPTPVLSFATAARFLAEYCKLHNIVDQAVAALSSVLFLPILNRNKNPVSLPRPYFHAKRSPRSAMPETKELKQCGFILDQIVPELDRLLTLSCNTRGLLSLLSSVFYEPGIPCNAVSPWMQATFAVLDSVEESHLLGYILMNRVPQVSFLWLGGIITGTQKNILREGRYGVTSIEPHAASWCGVTQSFIQAPVSQPLITNGALSRSDECRLLYLSQAELNRGWPLTPWMPFGTTILEDAEIEVRLHAQCTGHELQYADWYWACRDSKQVHPICVTGVLSTFTPTENLPLNMPVSYEALNPKDESASQHATRNIFIWLRNNEYSAREQGIRNHDWVALDESDDDSLLSNKSSRSDKSSVLKTVEAWILNSC
ncbi:hypothetical protein TESG_01855 [Trichophyton tonsurans CBS 112818]|uniref:Uncharacterized protein n=1 Tax=Trichophyton tonsurans (strain CBS 112818) TaxID=647933 RepID=F2RSN6_TRIT1|nr:hypothetical protein TESG_01855 [Trichophyton tonsurans CBS 112818]